MCSSDLTPNFTSGWSRANCSTVCRTPGSWIGGVPIRTPLPRSVAGKVRCERRSSPDAGGPTGTLNSGPDLGQDYSRGFSDHNVRCLSRRPYRLAQKISEILRSRVCFECEVDNDATRSVGRTADAYFPDAGRFPLGLESIESLQPCVEVGDIVFDMQKRHFFSDLSVDVMYLR